MPKLLSSREVVSILQKNGLAFVSQKGSHAKYKKFRDGHEIVVIVPVGKKEIPMGTLRSIVRQSQLPKEKFFGSAMAGRFFS
ncbi:MAG: type II toxin-antitoxin system HicA family toxin [Patescibacteria group bacterium]